METLENRGYKFQHELHKKFLLRILKGMPMDGFDSNRLVLAYFSILGLDILGELESMPEAYKNEIIEWVYSLQVVNDKDNVSGFQGASTLNTHSSIGSNNSYKWGHIAQTYSALVILILLGDNLGRVNRRSIVNSLKYLQNKDGCFTASRLGGTESDMRFVFCAACISYILDDWSGVDIEVAMKYIINSITYEQAFGQGPELECHSGSTFCAVASLSLFDKLAVLTPHQKTGLTRWLLNRAKSGFSGRTNKSIDTCYSFWTGGALYILGAYHLTGPYEANRQLVLSTQDRYGGFSKWYDTAADPLHTCLGLGGLSIMRMDDLQEMYVPLNITKRGYERVKVLHESWQNS